MKTQRHKKFWRYALLLLLWSVSHVLVNAQTNVPYPSSLSLSGSVNLCNVNSNTDVYTSETNTGFNTAIHFRTEGRFFGLTGFQFFSFYPRITNTSTQVTEIINLQYFSVPVECGYHLYTKENFSMYVASGGLINTLFYAGDNSIGVKQGSLGKYGFGLKAGIGADIRFIFTEINYNYLLTEIYSEEVDKKSQLNCFEFSIGCRFTLSQLKKL